MTKDFAMTENGTNREARLAAALEELVRVLETDPTPVVVEAPTPAADGSETTEGERRYSSNCLFAIMRAKEALGAR